ncbi:MAG: HlyD family efflux transporter periplasmic adaptor subunit [Cytophagales bacterium]|nr:HlyD family efflux transporter periplasmic adaptor subunit [Cytophagales bacterium]
MRKYITIFVGILLIVAAAYIARDLSTREQRRRPRNEKVAPTVFTETIENSNTTVLVLESGRLLAKHRIEIFSEVQGVMQPTNKEFKPGATYRKGETVVSIRNDDFYANLQSQKSNLQNLITSILPDLRLDYPEAYKKWDEYLRAFDMDKPIRPLPEPSSDKERFFVTGRNIYTTYYSTKNMEIVLGKYNLRAPYSGVLTDALVTPGSLVRPGQKLGEFIDPTVFEMEVSVNKSILPSLKVGQSVLVRDTENHTLQWKGKIIRINGRVDRATQTVMVYIELNGKDLKEGMYLEAVMEGESIENSVEISRSLLIDESKVYIVQDSSLLLVDIDPVFFNEKTVVVRGLEDGQQLVSKAVPGAYAGMEVKIFQ